MLPHASPLQLDTLMARLGHSSFRSRFRLGPREQAYLAQKGLGTVQAHAREFITQRLAPAHPERDGRQTPMKGHPAFIAQHATATCCRRCLLKWHGIPQGHALTPGEQAYVVEVIKTWLLRQPGGI